MFACKNENMYAFVCVNVERVRGTEDDPREELAESDGDGDGQAEAT